MRQSLSLNNKRCAACCATLLVAAAAAPPALTADHTAGRPAYLGPAAVAAAGDGKTLYVACADARQILWVDVAAGTVTRRAAVPARPTGIALLPDQSQLVVTCAAPRSTVLLLDAATGQTLGRIPVGHTAVSPVVSGDGRRLYVCNRFDNEIAVIGLAERRVLRRVPAEREPIAAALAPDGRTLVVANLLPNMRTNVKLLEEVTPVVTVVDTSSWRTEAVALPTGSHSLRGVAIGPEGRYAFVTHLLGNFQELPFRVDMGWVHTNVVSIIDLPRREVVSTIGLDEMDRGAPNPWAITLADGGRLVCVTLAGSHQLAVIDRQTLVSDEARRRMSPMIGAWPIYLGLGASLWQRIDLPGKGPRSVTAAGRRIFVAEYFSDTVAVVAPAAGGASWSVRSIPLGPPPRLTLARRGELLFHDAAICFQQWQSCASCHPDGRQDALNWDLLNDGAGNPKNTKSLLLAHRTPPAMAEQVRPSAEEAVRAGILNILFTQRPDEEAAAIDAYLQSLQPVPSPYLVDGRLRPAAQRGRRLFFSREIGCNRCHPPPLYTDLKRHRVGTQNPTDRTDQFDTPTLIEVWRTAPYLHDGRYVTVEQLLDQGRHGLHGHKQLTPQQIADLAEFVLSL